VEDWGNPGIAAASQLGESLLLHSSFFTRNCLQIKNNEYIFFHSNTVGETLKEEEEEEEEEEEVCVLIF